MDITGGKGDEVVKFTGWQKTQNGPLGYPMLIGLGVVNGVIYSTCTSSQPRLLHAERLSQVCAILASSCFRPCEEICIP